MNAMTTFKPRTIRRIHPKPLPLLLLPAWRVQVPDAREGRLRALVAKQARRAAAFQPVEVVVINAAFRARLEAITARNTSTNRYTHAMAGR
jgi:hypothetical protein